MRLRFVFATALLTLAASPAALAWSALGHQMVGELAQRHISPEAQAQVDLLLAGEPDPTLAVSLVFGILVSTVLTLVVIPLLYFSLLAWRRKIA